MQSGDSNAVFCHLPVCPIVSDLALPESPLKLGTLVEEVDLAPQCLFLISKSPTNIHGTDQSPSGS